MVQRHSTKNTFDGLSNCPRYVTLRRRTGTTGRGGVRARAGRKRGSTIILAKAREDCDGEGATALKYGVAKLRHKEEARRLAEEVCRGVRACACVCG